MKRTLKILRHQWKYLLITCVMANVVNATPLEKISPISLTLAQLQKLEHGDIIVTCTQTGALNRAEMYAIVKAPINDIWELFGDNAHFIEWNKEIKLLEVTEKSGNQTRIKGINNMPWPMTDRRWDMWTETGSIELQGNNYLFLSWEYIKGTGNIIDSQGYWLGLPYGKDNQSTLLKYVIHADFGIWLPNSVINWFSAKVLPNNIKNLQDIHQKLYSRQHQ